MYLWRTLLMSSNLSGFIPKRMVGAIMMTPGNNPGFGWWYVDIIYTLHINGFTGFLERTSANIDAWFGHQQQSTPPFLNHHHDAYPAMTTIHRCLMVTTHDVAIQSKSPPPSSVSTDNHPRCHIDVATKQQMTTAHCSSFPIWAPPSQLTYWYKLYLHIKASVV